MSAESQEQIPQEQGWRSDFATRFKPGISPNPGGRPKNRPNTNVILDRLGAMTVEDLEAYQPENAAEAACKVQVLNAATGKALEALPSFREITDRTEGKAPQKVEMSGQVNHLVLQVQILEQTAQELAEKHGVSVELARERLMRVEELRQLVER
jgi:hypothetical protein